MEHKRWYPDVFQHLQDQLNGDVRVYFATQGIFGCAYSLIHDGGVPVYVDNSVLSVSGQLQFSLLNTIRWQLLLSDARSIGVDICREVFNVSPAQFICDIFLPLVLGAVSAPLQHGSIIVGDKLRRILDLLMSFRNKGLTIADRDSKRAELRSLFPRSVPLTDIDHDALHFLSYGAVQVVDSGDDESPRMPFSLPPIVHGGHYLARSRNRLARRRSCRRRPECPTMPWDRPYDSDDQFA